MVPLLPLAQPPAFSSVFQTQRAGAEPQCCAGGGEGGLLPFLAKPLGCSPPVLMCRVPSVTHCLPPPFHQASPPPQPTGVMEGQCLPCTPFALGVSCYEPQVFKISWIKWPLKLWYWFKKLQDLLKKKKPKQTLQTVCICHCFLHNRCSFELSDVFSHNYLCREVFIAQNFPNFTGSETFPISKLSHNHSTLEAQELKERFPLAICKGLK